MHAAALCHTIVLFLCLFQIITSAEASWSLFHRSAFFVAARNCKRTNGRCTYGRHVPYSYQSQCQDVASTTSSNIDKAGTSLLSSLQKQSLTEEADEIKLKPQEAEAAEARQILTGRHKWLGGAVSPIDGSVYGIPSHSGHIICLSPCNTNCISDDNNHEARRSTSYEVNFLPLPSFITDTSARKYEDDKAHQFKWLRGIIVNETLFGIPSWSQLGVLTVDIAAWRKWQQQQQDIHTESKQLFDEPKVTIAPQELSEQIISILPLPQTLYLNDTSNQNENKTNKPSKRWMWHGAALNQNSTAIYCIPSNSQHVLKINLTTLTTLYLPIPSPENTTTIPSTNKWYGGILGCDNAIYGIPYAAGSVLRINANNDSIDLLGDFGSNKYNWHGGVLSKRTGCIYAFPAHSETVLKIDTNVGVVERLETLPIERAEYDVDGVRRYKWLGGCIGADEHVYGMPSDASSVLCINTTTNKVTTFGHVKTTDGAAAVGDNDNSLPEKNKWQGGVLGKDGFIYAVPSNAKGVLRIDTRPESKKDLFDPYRISIVGDLPNVKDKWQGGFLVESGAIYGIPENCDRILEVLPPTAGDGGSDKVVVRMLT